MAATQMKGGGGIIGHRQQQWKASRGFEGQAATNGRSSRAPLTRTPNINQSENTCSRWSQRTHVDQAVLSVAGSTAAASRVWEAVSDGDGVEHIVAVTLRWRIFPRG